MMVAFRSNDIEAFQENKPNQVADLVKPPVMAAITELDMSLGDDLGITSDEFLSPPYSQPNSSSLPSDSRDDSECEDLVLQYGSATVLLSAKLQFAAQIRALWKDFKRLQLPTSPSVKTKTLLTSTELLAQVLVYKISRLEDDNRKCGRQELVGVVGALLEAFEAQFNNRDVHSVILSMSSMSEDAKFACISAYFRARGYVGLDFCAGESVILQAVNRGSHSAYAIFGGQGLSSVLDELRQLSALYGPILGDFIQRSSRYLNSLIKDNSPVSELLPKGLNVAAWIDHPDTQAGMEYLVKAPVSFPLIGVLQLANYKVLLHLLGRSPKDKACFFQGIAGHSQGVVPAIVASIANDWNSFEALSLTALHLLFSIGCRSQEAFDCVSVGPVAMKDSEDNGEGVPSCMLGIKGLPYDQVGRIIKEVNDYLPRTEQIELALINGPVHFVLGGPPSSLYCFNKYLRLIRASPNISQTRLPFSKRKPVVNTSYLPITAPFHTSYLSAASEIVIEDLRGFEFNRGSLNIPVYDTTNGQNLMDGRDEDLIPHLVRMIMKERLDWIATTNFSKATLLIDLGPGGIKDGMGSLTDKNKRGTSVRTINFSTLKASSSDIGDRSELFSLYGSLKMGSNWQKEYSPALIIAANGQTILETKFSRLFGLPPVMVAGMTPTTCSWEFVSETMNAGYHIELAAGGYHNADTLEAAIRCIIKSIPIGRGVTCNVIYANPRALKWQISLIKRLRAKNWPIEGLTIGAGIPSLDVANSYIRDLGLKHISFKPGSIQAVKEVVEIAKANPNFPIILQWTGGRAGGHHSFEDFHEPILETYHNIRACSKLILVAGSGFGDVRDSYPYLSGQWSVNLGYAHMPFDAVLLGSRVMVAAESKTSQEAKRLICQLSGVVNKEWEGTYERETGGIMTVTSEMGEPIHKIATRAVKLWAYLDKTIFCIKDNPERLRLLRKKQDYIISRLNADYSKVWFGSITPGQALNFCEMSYLQVLSRFINLTYLSESKKWMDKSYRDLFYEFLTHLEARFISDNSQERIIKSVTDVEEPESVLKLMQVKFQNLSVQLINHQDQQIFTSMCRGKGRKPVPFILALDEEFEYWFKKDSLWQSENLETVREQDVGRVCILHGPVAARYSSNLDEPIKDILGGLYAGYMEEVRKLGTPTQYNHFSAPHDDGDVMISDENDGFDATNQAEKVTNASKNRLLVEKKSRRHIAFSSKTVIRGQKVFDNPILDVFKIGSNMWIETQGESDLLDVISLYELSQSMNETKKVAELRITDDGTIELEIFAYDAPDQIVVSLVLHFKLVQGLYPLREETKDRNKRIKDFYHHIWFGKKVRLPVLADIHDIFHGPEFIVSSESLRQFILAVTGSSSSTCGEAGRHVPIDYAVVVAWEALVQPLFLVDGNLLDLVHLKNEFRQRPGASPIMENDNLSSTSYVTALLVQDAGTMIEVTAQISRGGSTIIDVVSQFLFRNTFVDYGDTFRNTKDPNMVVEYDSPKAVAVLLSKKWFKLDDPGTDLLGKKLVFTTQTWYRYGPGGVTTSADITGEISEVVDLFHGTTATVGRIAWQSDCGNNIVSDYLNRHGHLASSRVIFDNTLPLDLPVSTLSVPSSNKAYARVSGDFNPIHISRVTAALAKLPDTITHGMHISAKIRNIIGQQVGARDNDRFRAFSTSFTNMVLPDDNLQLALQHVGMSQGCKLFHFQAQNSKTGITVIEGEAEVDCERAAYLFTGQGSQKKGMGMDLRQSSSSARRLWDRADAYFLSTYGFRISEIVIKDPKELKIHFGGIHGRKIRQNYIELMYQRPGHSEATQIFREIDHSTSSYIFRSDTGLLSATQFTQPALTLMELAIFEDLDSRGVLPKKTIFAGHSLGEYTAISALGKLVPVETLMSIVFYRGLAMQVAVERDELNRSPFAMCAINPQKLSPALDQPKLELAVQIVAKQTGYLLEIVNYNVESTQYVCAGDVRAISCLSMVLDSFGSDRPKTQLPNSFADFLTNLVESHIPSLSETPLSTNSLKRGIATTPLTGIDIPFHSSFMKSGIPAFRRFLYSQIRPCDVDPAKFIDRYVPNLTAAMFSLSKDYFERTFKASGSLLLARILRDWDKIVADDCVPDSVVGLLRSFREEVDH